MASISDVTGNVNFLPYKVEGVHGREIQNLEPICLDQKSSEELIAFLESGSWGSAVEQEFKLQGISERFDGTKLLSAFIPPDRLIDLLSDADDGFSAHIDTVNEWISNHQCNEVIVSFVDKRFGRESSCQETLCAG